ncbi:MAG TPA: choice-of-anchor tandem repeat GloVer-containing protein [Verrucomicrobiae bacterium]|jgi:uncharacterized repeat protein (TIGR03803 family)|nr:choice-of-anchor tandem repeat GloVer-containing protein [Verrucomicrobiae bacterium]
MLSRILTAAFALFAALSGLAQPFSSLFSFDYDEAGADPLGKPLIVSNVLYGTSLQGGINGGGGTVFSMNVNGSGFLVLHPFGFGGTDGTGPNGGVVLVGNRIYGTASGGGASNSGTIFGVDTTGGHFSVLHTFSGVGVSSDPTSGLLAVGDTLYGVTYAGAVYSIKTNGGSFTILHSFTVGNEAPLAQLNFSRGVLYGTTSGGGLYGGGTVFSINTNGSGFRTLHDFSGDTEGSVSLSGVQVVGDMLYGNTSEGGLYTDGTIFSLAKTGSNFVVLHTFSGVQDGAYPNGDFAVRDNVIYGATPGGGDSEVGVVFSMNTDGSGYTNLYQFVGDADGSDPQSGVVVVNNTIYGAAAQGGANFWGDIFSYGLPVTPNLLVNGSFEAPVGVLNGASLITPTGWTQGAGSSALENGAPAANFPDAEDGQQYLALTVPNDSIYQTFTVAASGRYQVSWFDSSSVGGATNAAYSVTILNDDFLSISTLNLDGYNGGLNWRAKSLPLYLAPGNYSVMFQTPNLAGEAAPCLDHAMVTPLETNALDNGDFENPAIESQHALFAHDTFGPWTLEQSGSDVVIESDFNGELAALLHPTPFGSQFANFDASGASTLRQDLNHSLRGGATYALTFFLSGTATPQGEPVQLTASIDYAGTTNIARRATFSLADGADWTSEEFDFIPPVDGNYTLRLISATGDAASVDNISIVPTPLALPLEIYAQPEDVTGVTVGSSASFSVGAQSSAESVLQYQWRLNGVNISGATNSVLTIPIVHFANGGIYDVLVSDGNALLDSDYASLTITVPAVANNDNLANAAILPSVADGAVASENFDATVEAGETPILPGNAPSRSIWFTWTAPVTGVVQFTTAGSGFDTVLGAFQGGVATRAGLADDDAGGNLTSLITFNATAGQLYIIGVDGHHGAAGPVVLSWSESQTANTVPNILTPPAPVTVVTNNTPVSFSCQADNGSVLWFKAGDPVNPVAGGVSFSIPQVDDTTVGTYYAVVTSDSGPSTRTEPFQLQINLLEDGTSASNSLAYNKFSDAAANPFLPPPPQETHVRTGGGDTRGFTTVQVYNTAGNVSEPGEPAICGQIGGAPEWYAYTAPTNGDLLVNTAGSSFNTMLGVFTGTGSSFASLTSVGCAYTVNRTTQGQPSVFVPNVAAKQTLYIVVDGYKGASGAVHLNINMGQPVTAVVPPQDQYVSLPGSANFSIVAQGSTPISYQWQFAGQNLLRETNAVLNVTGIIPSQLGLYSVVASNLVSQATFSASLALASAVAIQTQPVSTTVPAGSTVQLSVAATGGPLPAYFWKFNGANALGNGNTLSIPNFQAANEGTYSVIVSNILGAVPSSEALVLLDTLRFRAPQFSGGIFQLHLSGVAGRNYAIQTSTNLSQWTPLATNTAVHGFMDYSDTNGGAQPALFYRAVTN